MHIRWRVTNKGRSTRGCDPANSTCANYAVSTFPTHPCVLRFSPTGSKAFVSLRCLPSSSFLSFSFSNSIELSSSSASGFDFGTVLPRLQLQPLMHRRLSRTRAAVRGALCVYSQREERERKKIYTSNRVKVAAPWEITRMKYPTAGGCAKCKDNENVDKIARRPRHRRGYSPAFSAVSATRRSLLISSVINVLSSPINSQSNGCTEAPCIRANRLRV